MLHIFKFKTKQFPVNFSSRTLPALICYKNRYKPPKKPRPNLIVMQEGTSGVSKAPTPPLRARPSVATSFFRRQEQPTLITLHTHVKLG